MSGSLPSASQGSHFSSISAAKTFVSHSGFCLHEDPLVLICAACQVAVDARFSSRFRAHCSKSNIHDDIDCDRIWAALEKIKNEGVNFDPIGNLPAPSTDEPISGLSIHQGSRCSVCGLLSTSSRVIDIHRRDTHNRAGETISERVQTWARKGAIWVVKENVRAQADLLDAFDQLLADVGYSAQSDPAASAGLSSAADRGWERIAGWNTILGGRDRTALVDMIRDPSEIDDPEHILLSPPPGQSLVLVDFTDIKTLQLAHDTLYDTISSWFRQLNSGLSKLAPAFRQLLFSHEPSEGGGVKGSVRCFDLADYQSVHRYSVLWTSVCIFLWSLWRQYSFHNEVDSSHHNPLTLKLVSSFPVVQHEAIDFACEALDEALWTAVQQGSSGQDAQHALIIAVANLSHAIASVPLHDIGVDSPLLVASAVLAIDSKEEYALRPVASHSRVMSMLVWSLKASVWGWHRLVNPTADNQAIIAGFHAVRNQLLVFGKTTLVAEALFTQHAYAMQVARKAVGAKSFSWSEDGSMVATEGELIRMADLSAYIREQVLEAARRTLAIFTLLGLDPVENSAHYQANQLRDDLSSLSTDWSFASHPSNTALKTAAMAFKQAAVRFCFPVSSDSSAPELDSTCAKTLLSAVDLAQRAAFLAIFVSTGHCPRVQDLISATYKNQYSSKRDLFLGPNGQLSLTLGSHKTGYRENVLTARFLSPLMSDVVGTLVSIIRPAIDQIRALSAKVSPSPLLFVVKSGDAVDWRDISRWLSRQTLALGLGVSLGPLAFRQLTAAVVTRHFSSTERRKFMLEQEGGLSSQSDEDGGLDEEVQDLVDSDLPNVLHRQAAHSIRTAQAHYGRDASMAAAPLSGDKMTQFQQASKAWRAYHGVDDELPSSLGDLHRLSQDASEGVDEGSNQTDEGGEDQSGEQVEDVKVSESGLVFRTTGPKVQQVFALSPAAHPSKSGEGHSSAHLLALLSKLRGVRTRSFSLREQEIAIRVALSSPPINLLACLPTSAGKTAIWQLLALLHPLVIIILPFLALIHDAQGRAASSGLRSHAWTSGDSESTIPADVQVVFVTPERLLTPSCSQFAAGLNLQDRLGAMVFDEAHVYLHDDYRASTHAVSKATVLPHLRYIFLSGTVAPFLEQTLADRLNLGSLTVVRALTVRPNIKYQVTADDAVVMGQDGLEDRLIELGVDAVNKHQLESGQGGGVLVICRTREMAYKLGGALSCGVYVSESEGTPEAEAAMDAMEQFLKKTTSILVGTSAAGTGIHRDDLRAVIHVGLPWQKVDFAQQSGRAGRDGLRAISSILTHTTEIRQQQEGHIEQDSFSILDFVTTTGCRRATLSAVLDGDAIGCLAVEDGVLCDNCDRDMEEALEGVGMAIEMKEEEEEGYMMESGGVPWSDSPGVPSSIPAASSSSTRSSMAPPPVPLPRHSTPTSQPVPKRRRMNPLTSATRAIALTPEPSSSQISVRSPSMVSSPVSRLASDESQVLQEGPFAAPSVSQYMPTPPRASQPRRSGSASMSSAPPQRSGVGALRSGSHSMRLVSSATASSSRLPAPAPSSVPGAFTSASNILARNQAGVDRQATEGQVAGLVEELKGQCAVCFVQDCDFNHAPGRCPNFPYASGNVSQIGRWSSRLKFDSNYSACFGCAMPLETCKLARGGVTCTGSTHPTAVREITLALVDDPTLFQRAMGEVRRNRPGFALTPPTPGGSVPTDWRKKVGEFNNRYWQGWVLVEALLVGAKGRRRL